VLGGWLALVAWLVYAGPIAYLIFLVVVALVADRSASWRDRLLFLLVLPTMHLSWGLGFLIGVVRGARDVSDTSRTDN
jgi:succinoglycan biosynthesis protein ExoA